MTGIEGIRWIEPLTCHKLVDRIPKVGKVEWTENSKKSLNNNTRIEPISPRFVSISESNSLKEKVQNKQHPNNYIRIHLCCVTDSHRSKEKNEK